MKRLIASHALAGTAVALPWPALLAEVWTDTADPGLLGLAGAARYLPCLLLSAVIGGIGDRFGRYRTVWLVTLARLVLLSVTAALLAAGAVWPALLAATATVAAGVPAFPSLVAAVPGLARDADRATGALVTVEISAFAVGPAVGGLLLAGGPAVSVAAAVPLMLAAHLLLPAGFTDPVRPAGRMRLAEGLRAVLQVPDVRRAIVAVMAVNAVLGVLGVGLLSITEQHWQAGTAEFGWATAVLGFSSLAAPALLVALRRRPPATIAQLLVVLPLVATALAPNWTTGAVPLAVLGAGLTVVECRTTRMLQVSAPQGYTAVALGVADAALVGAALLGALAAPWLAAIAGPVGLLLTVAAAAAAVLAGALRRRRPVAVRSVELSGVRAA